MSSYIVMQAYGHEEAFHTCLMALLSLSKFHTPGDCPQIYIYTDNANWFSPWNCPLPLHFRAMDGATIRAWRGQIDFVHRVKIEVLRDFCATHDGAVLYTDTDVLFLQSLAPLMARIAGGERFMHVSEGRFDSGHSPMLGKLHRFLSTAKMPEGTMATPANATMWNAGVLGFHTNLIGLLDEVLHYTDKVYPMFPKHIVEQAAFSLHFTKTAQMHNAFSYVFHYWIIKEHRAIVASFFSHYAGRPWQDLVHLSALIQIPELIQQKTSFFINRSVSGKIRKLQWQPPIPDWDELERQL